MLREREGERVSEREGEEGLVGRLLFGLLF